MARPVNKGRTDERKEEPQAQEGMRTTRGRIWYPTPGMYEDINTVSGEITARKPENKNERK